MGGTANMAWGVYKNGNSICKINLKDGTKIRETNDDFWDLEFPESIYIACTSYCDGGCPFCYANCSTDGKHAELMNVKFIDTLHPYTEVALQMNDLSHPQLIPFLKKLRDQKILANITVNQKHFERHEDLLWELYSDELVKGIGISLVNPTNHFIASVQKFPTAVIHTINGILTKEDVEKMSDFGLKILILGYKNLGRGVSYNKHYYQNITDNQIWLNDHLAELPNHFKVVSFDNLAIEQLNVRRILSDEEWDSFYLGDEGTASMYVDLVTGKFGVSSLCKESEMMPIMPDIKDMFAIVKQTQINK
jgi:hypothetical protein